MARDTMRAMVLRRFGGIDALELGAVPIPETDSDEILLRVEWAGVGEWDAFEREGGYAQMLGQEGTFPYVLGSEGAGTVVRCGSGVSRFQPGDRVYVVGFLNPKGGFYAEYAAVNAAFVAPLPNGMSMAQASAVSGVALTALRGLGDVLKLQGDERLIVFGAGGGVGHVAVQIAKRMGVRVLAIASGEDGVALAKRAGADEAIDGRSREFRSMLQSFRGAEAALLTAGGTAAQESVSVLREGGRVAYPNGVNPVPGAPAGVTCEAFNCDPDPELVSRLSELMASAPLDVHLARTFPLEQAADAHRAIEDHYLGKLALHVTPDAAR